jgi:hypothetical protein
MRRFIVAIAAIALFVPTASAFAVVSSMGSDGSTGGVGESAAFTLDTSGVDNTQGGKYQNGQGFNGTQANVAEGIAGAAVQCTFTSGLSEFLKSLIEHLIGSIIEETTTLVPIYLTSVPTFDVPSNWNEAPQRAKEVCSLQIWGFCILPSLDSIAYCFINEIIHYIGQATIEWIKTGFQGSPAFVDDPEKFFTNAVDSAAGQFINQITDGLLCEPWRAQVQLRLLNEHVGSFQQQAQGCRLSEVSDKWEDFTNGKYFNWDLQYAYTQNPYNNPRGSLIEARNGLNAQVNATQHGLEVQLGWSDGFLHVKDPETGRITTPGRVLESQINRRLGNAENRLLIADEFDEVVNTLVNELVRIALSEVFDGDGGSESEDGQLEGEFEGGGGEGGGEDNEQQGGGETGGGGTAGGGQPAPTGTNLEASCDVSDTEVLEGQRVVFSAGTTGAVGAVSFDWDGDLAAFGQTASTTFAEEGTYRVSVLATDHDFDNESDRATCPAVRVIEDFAVSCTVSDTSPKRGERVTYTAVVSGADGEIADYDWGGAASGLGESIDETYGSAGTYRVHVEVADEEGNRRTADCPNVVVAR